MEEFREELEHLEVAQKAIVEDRQYIDTTRVELDAEVEQVHTQLEEARFLHSQEVEKGSESLKAQQAELVAS